METKAAPSVVLQCTSCGAASLVAPQLVSTGCPYCHSQLVDSDRAAPIVDCVAPFRIARRAAQDRIARHLASRWWAPEALRRRARKGELMPDTMRGVLVPFYVYDATCRSRFRTQVGVHWMRSETHYEPGADAKPGKRVTKQVQETEWFPLAGTSVADWHDHLVSASVGLAHPETSALAPFDLGRAVTFDPRLLAGWEAELPSRDRAAVDSDAVGQLRRLETRRVTEDVLPGDTHRHTSVDCDVKVRGVRLALLPVWVVTWRYGDKAQRLLIHGQTGRCVGGAPISRPKIAALSALVAAIVLAILWKTGVLPWPR